MQDKGGGKGGHFYPESTPHNTCKNHLTDVPELGSGTSCTLVPSLILHTPLAPAPLAVLATCRFPAVRALRQDSKPSRKRLSFPSCLSGMSRPTSSLSSCYFLLCQATPRKRSCSFSFVLTALCLQLSSSSVTRTCLSVLPSDSKLLEGRGVYLIFPSTYFCCQRLCLAHRSCSANIYRKKQWVGSPLPILILL